MTTSDSPRHVIVIGGGPAGLMAAERLAQAGVSVDLYDAMASVGRKFLLAGKGGLNLTHSEVRPDFDTRFFERQPHVAAWLDRFDGEALRAWAAGLGVETFVGTSGRVFPQSLKAAPLLRAWLSRLRGQGVRFHMRHRWLGWTDDGGLRFQGPDGEHQSRADAVVLALGGASWPQLGSDGAWAPLLSGVGAEVAPLRAANCGFDLGPRRLDAAADAAPGWSPFFAEKFAGQPIKPVALSAEGVEGRRFARQGEFVVTATGIEGSLVYAASALLREAIERQGEAVVHLDLLPGRDTDWVVEQVAYPRGSRSLSSHLKSRLNIEGLKAGLLHEVLSKEEYADPAILARTLKALPLRLRAARPVAEAISTAGGVRLESLDAQLMLKARPGVFIAGEMLDWEAPTGGYLLTASMASGLVAGEGAAAFLA
ncbi:NAD(P)/FAD-dependent oxidoreductase [Roseateles amylovorans]|uniref:TIGR03862 family flavoprotein n=1 Tax=Roseateles amylovorans TaxID=2978473 RepID=A0ABY6AY17_9BURK|nr:TIGR03862 family flavoprotein [Roseateles amylovorans]UXH77188.1 TIGR03862 family flavoprotein [Roseateles amylovorans]